MITGDLKTRVERLDELRPFTGGNSRPGVDAAERRLELCVRRMYEVPKESKMAIHPSRS